MAGPASDVESADRVTLAANDVSRQDLVSLEARHRWGRGVLVGDEKEAALAVADRIIFALKPGRAVGIVLCFPARFMGRVLESILDHGDRNLPCRRSAVMPVQQL